MQSQKSTRSRGRRKQTSHRVLPKNLEKPTTKAQRRFIRALRHELGDAPTAVPDTREWAAREIQQLLARKGRPTKPSRSEIKNAKAVAVSIERDKAQARLKLEVADEQAQLKAQALERMARL